MSVMENFLQLNVGGIPYCIAKCHIEKFPESYFACLIKKEWSAERDQAIKIARDGELFQFINAFLVSGSLPRRSVTGCPSLDRETIKRLKVEADFYCLTELVLQCQHYFRPTTEVNLPNYLLMQRFLEQLRGYVGGSYELPVEYYSDLAKALKPLSVPFCLVGEQHQKDGEFNKSTIYNQSTCANPNIAELLAAFAPPPLESDPGQDQRALEIEASKLKWAAVQAVGDRVCPEAFAPGSCLTLRPHKLVLHQTGASQELGPVLPLNVTEGHIGTLVVILNSEYTGGELEVTHGGRTKVVTGPYSWVAMYGDCLHKINAVTSGTRASLIYDIYGTPRTDNLWDNHQDSAVRSFWSEHYRTKWFSNGYGGKKFGFKRLAEAEKDRILDCLDAELANSGPDGVIIALQKLYPDYQNVDPSALQDADRALYDLLTNATTDRNDNHNCDCDTIRHSSNYDVQIVTVVIYRCQQEFDRDGENSTRCMLFSTAAVERELGTGTGTAYDSDTEVEMDITSDEGEEKEGDDSRNIDGQKLEGEGKEEEEEEEEKEEEGNPVVLLPYPLDVTGLLEYTQENWKVGIPEQFVFMVTCLHVRKATK